MAGVLELFRTQGLVCLAFPLDVLSLAARGTPVSNCPCSTLKHMSAAYFTPGIWKHALRLSALLSTLKPSFHAKVIDAETLNSAAAIADKVSVLLASFCIDEQPTNTF